MSPVRRGRSPDCWASKSNMTLAVLFDLCGGGGGGILDDASLDGDFKKAGFDLTGGGALVGLVVPDDAKGLVDAIGGLVIIG